MFRPVNCHFDTRTLTLKGFLMSFFGIMSHSDELVAAGRQKERCHSETMTDCCGSKSHGRKSIQNQMFSQVAEAAPDERRNI